MVVLSCPCDHWWRRARRCISRAFIVRASTSTNRDAHLKPIASRASPEMQGPFSLPISRQNVTEETEHTFTVGSRYERILRSSKGRRSKDDVLFCTRSTTMKRGNNSLVWFVLEQFRGLRLVSDLITRRRLNESCLPLIHN